MSIDVVADSNIYISALVFGGRPLQFLEAARSQVFRLAISDPLVSEIIRILRDKFRLPPADLDEVLADLSELARLVHPTERIDAITEDPDDNRVLECAVAAGARYIVSGDNDLLRLARYRDIRIMRVAEFLELITP